MRHALTATENARRLDAWLRAHFPEPSRSALQRLILEGNVLLNGQAALPSARVRAGDRIEVHFPPPRPASLLPEARDLDILYEDGDLLVVNKPAGTVVHPGAGRQSGTLVHALLHHCRGQLSGIGGKERPGIVHRLDKDTSGCLVVAKNDAAHRALAAALKAREFTKVYLALVCGLPRNDRGRLDAPIGRHAVHRQRMTVRKDGRSALTEWKVLARSRETSLLECRIFTGRTHQIRVHLAFLGHPVLGDTLYGQRAVAAQTPCRQMLHAWQLGFRHPRTAQPLEFTAPIPEDFRSALDDFRKAQ